MKQRAEIGHRCCCWLACLAPLGRCANILQFEPWKLLWASGEAVFCFVWLQQVAWITPFCRLLSLAPRSTEAGLGHCDFTRLSYSPSLCFWVCCHKQTDTIHLSLVNTPTKSLAANSDHSLFSPPFPNLKQPLHKFKIKWLWHHVWLPGVTRRPVRESIRFLCPPLLPLFHPFPSPCLSCSCSCSALEGTQNSLLLLKRPLRVVVPLQVSFSGVPKKRKQIYGFGMKTDFNTTYDTLRINQNSEWVRP